MFVDPWNDEGSMARVPWRHHPRHVEELVHWFPHLAWRDADAAVVAALSAESQRVIAEVRPALFRVIELVPGGPGTGTTYFKTAPQLFINSGPQLLLKFLPLNVVRERAPHEIPATLRAFAVLATHSRRLDEFPALKMQFWIDVLRSDMAHETTRDVQSHEFIHPSFPAFVIDFEHYERTFVVDTALEDALVEFMTTPVLASSSPALSERPISSCPSPLSFGFVFRSCDLRVESLEVIERFLARAFASSARQYGVHMLELSDRHLMSPELAVLARIVRKCVYEYGVEELRLDSIIRGCVKRRADWVYPEGTPRAILAIARSVFGIETMPALTSRCPSSLPTAQSPPALRRLSMNRDDLFLEFFAARFSALRYGCPLEEDVTVYMRKNAYGTKNHQDYWRWLAFGYFYPRPKRFARRLKLHNISHIEQSPEFVRIMTQTMRNPASELIFGGNNEASGSDIVPTTELMVCVVQAGASVNVFQTGSLSSPTWSDSFAAECELEAIYERADGAVCVVVPGLGLGWVRADSVVRIEREPLSSDRSEQDGLFAGDLAWDSQWRQGNRIDVEVLRTNRETMIETLGRQFYSLTFGPDPFDSGFLRVVLESCPNLKRLTVGELHVEANWSNVFFDLLAPALRGRLEVLNLNRVTGTNMFYKRLYAMLSDPESVPKLRELRVGHMGVKELTMLHSALKENRMLAVVEVEIDQGISGPKDRIAAKRDLLDTDFQGELLLASISKRAKLAFLSVVSTQTSSAANGRAVHALDFWLVRKIFSFAADQEVRRTLIWNDSIEP